MIKLRNWKIQITEFKLLTEGEKKSKGGKKAKSRFRRISKVEFYMGKWSKFRIPKGPKTSILNFLLKRFCQSCKQFMVIFCFFVMVLFFFWKASLCYYKFVNVIVSLEKFLLRLMQSLCSLPVGRIPMGEHTQTHTHTHVYIYLYTKHTHKMKIQNSAI